MNWTAILADNGIPELPGRADAVAATLASTAVKKQAAVETRNTKRGKK